MESVCHLTHPGVQNGYNCPDTAFEKNENSRRMVYSNATRGEFSPPKASIYSKIVMFPEHVDVSKTDFLQPLKLIN